MIKKLMGVAVLSGVVGGGVMAMSAKHEAPDQQKVEQVIDARLHELLVKLNHR
ncbi:MAG: hypothetical protein IPJ65_06095 [Archangiaceae bacterium]|nr:hypothetical protein [Archangiaceae bacterium]